MDIRPIGIFDSGLGGLNVLKEIRKKLPKEDIIYLGDTKNFPYGNKTKENIIELSKNNIEFLIRKNVKLIVIACGTATSQALEEMQKAFDVPIIGIINPTVEHLKEENSKKIGVIATTGTIRSEGWQHKLLKKIDGAEVKGKACPLLAPMAEEGWTENEIAKLTIHEYVKDMKGLDALILGCTHYPLFKRLIEDELGENVEIINTGEMVANEVKEYIYKRNMENASNEANTRIFLTDLECNFINVAKKLLKDEELKLEKLE